MPYIITYKDEASPHLSHTHVYYEMVYVREGQVAMTIQGQEYHVTAGSLVFLNQFDEHSTRLLSDTYKRYYLRIPPTQLQAFHNDVLLKSVFRLRTSTFPYILSTGEAKPRFDNYFAMILDAYQRGGPYTDERLDALVTLVLTDAQTIRPDMFAPPNALSFLPIQNILDELDQRFAEHFSLSELARRYHVSPGCLSAHFHEQVGMSPMQYVTQRRLTHARVLLIKTNLTVAKIAALCGYNDASNFVRRFRQQYHTTPLQFRAHERTTTAAAMTRHISSGPGLDGTDENA